MRLRDLWLVLFAGLMACSEDGSTGPGGGGNHLPQAIIDAGVRPRVQIAGDVLQLVAASTDVDGDDLTHVWTLSGTAPGSLSATSGEDVQWTSGAGPGTATITLVSNDGTANSPTTARLDLLIGVAVPAGNIPNGTVWTAANGPYVVLQDIVVPQGATLTVGAGVQVFFRGPVTPSGIDKPAFDIHGILLANGTSTSRPAAVSFRGGRDVAIEDGAQWSGLQVYSSEAAVLQLNYCRIEEADTGIVAAGTAELRLFGGIVENNTTGISCVDPDGTGLGEGTVSTTSLRRVRVAGHLSTGILVGSSTLTLRQCTIASNRGTGISVLSSTDPALVDADSCRIELNGGSGGANVSFNNQSPGWLLRVLVQHSNFRVDPDAAPNNVSWGGCAYPPFLQDFDLSGNFWSVTTNNQSGLNSILATMSGYSAACDGDPAQWLFANGDWVIGAHSTGAP